MHLIIQHTEEYNWSWRSQKDRRGAEDEPDAHKADVILYLFIHCADFDHFTLYNVHSCRNVTHQLGA